MKFIVSLSIALFSMQAAAGEFTLRSYDRENNVVESDGVRTIVATRAKILRDKVEIADDRGNSTTIEIFWLKAMNIDTLKFATEAVRSKSMRVSCKTDIGNNNCYAADIIIGTEP